MSDIEYPVHVGESAKEWVFNAHGTIPIARAARTGTAIECFDVARRISAALNATRHLSVEELEAVAPDVMEVAVRYMVDNSGNAAKGE